MKVVLHDIKEITDSREMLEAKPHPFLEIFICSILVIMITALIWAYFGEIDVVAKTTGVVRPGEKISTINNKVMGKVESVFLEEGKPVKRGQLLYTIEHENQDLELKMTETDLIKARQELANLEKLKKSIVEGTNYFDSNIDSEAEYYNKYLKFQADYKGTTVEVAKDKSQLQKAKEALDNLTLVKRSAEQNRNLLNADQGEYYNQAEDYLYNVKRLNTAFLRNKEEYEAAQALFDSASVSEQELKNARIDSESSKLELDKYKNEFILNINNSLEKNKAILESLGSQRVGSGVELYSSVMLDKYVADTLVRMDDSITEKGKEISLLEKNLEALKLNVQDCSVAAPIDGVINIMTDINKGDLVQSGLEIATIVPASNTRYKVQLYVSNKDIANIRIGDKAKYHFMALPYKEYGELTGKITNIGTDAKVDQQKGTSYFLVEAEIENKPLYSYKGIKANIKVGMACEVYVITKTKKVLYYLLEKIDLS